MLRLSDSDDETPHSSNHNERMSFIASARRAELNEAYNEEMEETMINRKRRRSFNESSDSDFNDVDDKDGYHDRMKRKKEDDDQISQQGTSVAHKLMQKMGYKPGEGLGTSGQGRVEPIELSTQRGRVGLGHASSKVLGRKIDEQWDESLEEKTVTENVSWMPKCNDHDRENAATECEGDSWMEFGSTKLIIDDEVHFCSQDRLEEMLKAKQVFDVMNDRDLREARTRANPYETIGGAFFQNRAAMKAANLDKVFDWLFSGENPHTMTKKNPIKLEQKAVNTDREKEVFYFADVCAGPGGFSEYMLWRKGFYNTKGFGFTLAGKDDFKLEKFNASSPYFFEAFYGKHNNGDVMNPENIDSLEDFIMKGTQGLGVHLMMADGGFSVEGQENIQEILSKRLYLCQLLVSLCIVRENGNFFCKLFDIFTPFSVGLIYLMYVCYDQISLHKPHTSRPANSERYIICKGLRREYSNRIKNYLKRVNIELNRLKAEEKDKETDVVSIVPLEILRDDEEFFNYVFDHNERLAFRQETYLKKYLSFARNQGQIDKDQGDLREKCLEYWEVPDKPRPRNDDIYRQSLNAMGILGQYSPKLLDEYTLNAKIPQFNIEIISNPGDKQLKYAEYLCTFLSEKTPTQPKLLVSTATTVFYYDKGSWMQFEQGHVRIPAHSILMVEFTEYCSIDRNKVKKEKKVVRIVDAAVLHGDDISKLTYQNRMKAAEKFCKALHRVNNEVTVNISVASNDRRGHYTRNKQKITVQELVVAKYFSPSTLVKPETQENLKMYGNDLLLYEENGFFLQVTGVRFARMLKLDWGAGFSSKAQLIYAFRKDKSLFEKDFEKYECCATFWDIVIRKPNTVALHYIWKWENSLVDNYGFRVILKNHSHKSGITLQDLQIVIQETKDKAMPKHP